MDRHRIGQEDSLSLLPGVSRNGVMLELQNWHSIDHRWIKDPKSLVRALEQCDQPDSQGKYVPCDFDLPESILFGYVRSLNQTGGVKWFALEIWLYATEHSRGKKDPSERDWYILLCDTDRQRLIELLQRH